MYHTSGKNLITSHKITKNNDHVYLDVSIYNPGDSISELTSFTQTTDMPILDNSSDYNIYVSRLYLPSNSMELFAQKLPNTFFVGLNYLGVSYVIPVLYPLSPLIPDFRPIYNIYEFLRYINLAFEQAVLQINLAVPGLVPEKAPVMIYDGSRYRMYIPESFLTNGIRPSMSWSLYRKIQGFDVDFNGVNFNNISDGVLFRVYRTGDNIK
jgi:hypothetical protein